VLDGALIERLIYIFLQVMSYALMLAVTRLRTISAMCAGHSNEDLNPTSERFGAIKSSMKGLGIINSLEDKIL
jgi:hypothetical protein